MAEVKSAHEAWKTGNADAIEQVRTAARHHDHKADTYRQKAKTLKKLKGGRTWRMAAKGKDKSQGC